MRTPHPNAIAYEVTAKSPGFSGAPFHMCGHDFPLGQTVRVEVGALTPAKQAYLFNADPRDLTVVEIVAEDLPEEGAEVAAPTVDAPTTDAPAGDEPSDEPIEADESESGDLDGEDDEEPGDGAPAEGAAPAISAPPPAQRRKKRGKRK